MTDNVDFVDYYALLEVDPGCSADMLQKAYRYFAQLYHPDHNETADVAQFSAITEAYRVLGDPARRARYDAEHQARLGNRASASAASVIDDTTALRDAEMQQRILLFLYQRRREHPDDPGRIGFYIQQHLDCSEELFKFHSWFLKEKGWVKVDEQSELAITVEGIEHVMATSRSRQVEKLLLAGARSEAGNA